MGPHFPGVGAIGNAAFGGQGVVGSSAVVGEGVGAIVSVGGGDAREEHRSIYVKCIASNTNIVCSNLPDKAGSTILEQAIVFWGN